MNNNGGRVKQRGRERKLPLAEGLVWNSDFFRISSFGFRIFSRIANFDSEAPALTRIEALACGHRVQVRGSPPASEWSVGMLECWNAEWRSRCKCFGALFA